MNTKKDEQVLKKALDSLKKELISELAKQLSQIKAALEDKIETEVGSLAIMTQNEFAQIGQQFSGLRKDISTLATRALR
jgi:hypothetical protein